MSIEHILHLTIALLIAITIHEAAHAWMAYKLGDLTAHYAGRVTLNPIAHLDPLGTIMIFITFTTGFGLGWGKPVPYNPNNLKNPKMGALWIALAGPVSNLLCALVFTIPYKLIIAYPQFLTSGLGIFLHNMLETTIILNIALMAFNLLPIPPLDGSKVLAAFVPHRYDEEMHAFFQWGPFILLGVILFEDFFRISILGTVIGPVIQYTLMFIELIT